MVGRSNRTDPVAADEPRTADDVLNEDYTYVEPKFAAAFREGWKAREAEARSLSDSEPHESDALRLLHGLAGTARVAWLTMDEKQPITAQLAERLDQVAAFLSPPQPALPSEPLDRTSMTFHRVGGQTRPMASEAIPERPDPPHYHRDGPWGTQEACWEQHGHRDVDVQRMRLDGGNRAPAANEAGGLDVERLRQIVTEIGETRPWLLHRSEGIPNEGLVLADVIAADYSKSQSPVASEESP